MKAKAKREQLQKEEEEWKNKEKLMKQYATKEKFDPMKGYVEISPRKKLCMELHVLDGVESLRKARLLPNQKQMEEARDYEMR